MILKVDKRIYSKEVLLKTAYSLTDKAYIHLEQDEEYWIIHWDGKEGCQQTDVRELENELIAQQIREELLEQTADIRKLLLARAFASTVIETVEDAEDVAPGKEDNNADKTDPYSEKDILTGWFERNDQV